MNNYPKLKSFRAKMPLAKSGKMPSLKTFGAVRYDLLKYKEKWSNMFKMCYGPKGNDLMQAKGIL